MNTSPTSSKSDRIFPALILVLPFGGAIVAHFAFGVNLDAIGLVALLCLVLGGLYHILWRSTDRGPDELAVVFLIGEAIGAATLGMAFFRLFALATR